MAKCEICGGPFNERFLASHKRLAHRQRAATKEEELFDQIFALFERLTADGKQNILQSLVRRHATRRVIGRQPVSARNTLRADSQRSALL